MLPVNQIKLSALLSLTHLYVQIVCTRNLDQNNVWHVNYFNKKDVLFLLCVVFFSYQRQIISNNLDTFYLTESVCTNERHTKKNRWDWIEKWEIQWSDKHQKKGISNCMNFIFTERHTIYKFHLFLALCLNVSRTDSFI